MKRKTLLVLTLAVLFLTTTVTDILSAPRAPTQEFRTYMPLIVGSYPPSPPAYRLHADPDDLAWLAQDPYRDETIPATFTYGRSWETDIRYRGDASRLMSKKCWKVFFPGSDLFQGPRGPSQEELNLNADYPDQTLLRSYVGYDLFARAGVPAPYADFARLYMNDVYYGMFSQAEQVDKRFLHRMDIEIHGNLYKPYYGNLCSLDYISDPEEREWWYRHYYPKKTNRLGGHEDIIAFIELINHTPEAQFPEAIAEVLDVNEWLDWYAVNILIGNFEMMEKNHYFYHDLSTDRWLVLPWDLDLSLGHNMWGPGVGGLLDEEISWDNPIDSGTQESKKVDGKWNKLIDTMMNVPEFRFFHCRRLRELMADEFSPTEMFPHIDEAFEYIHHWAKPDPYRWQPESFQFSEGPEELKTYVVNRIQFLEEEMTTFCPDLDVPLTVNEFMADNASTVADEAGDYDDWIEIHNGSSTLSWDLGGMYLSDDSSEPTKWRIPGDTWLPPGGVLLLWADGEEEEGSLHTNFELDAAGGQIALFDRDVFGNVALSAQTYTAQETDVSHGRMPDGGDAWQSFSSPTPGWHNQGRPPAINGTAHAPTSPTSSDSVAVLALISDDGTTLTATLRYRAFEPGTPAPPLSPPREQGGSSPYYQQAPMYDDGAHGDNGPNDGIYGTTLPPQEDGTWVEYYIEAQDDTGMVVQNRAGWPQGDYRYIVGWQRPSLVINELMALNTHTLEDEDGDCDDWIEVYNTGTEAVDMSGMYFSDNVGLSTQYTIPAGTVIGPGEYRIFWADGDLPEGAAELPFSLEGAAELPFSSEGDGHLNFKLSGAGEYVGLFDSQAGHYGPIDAVYFDPQTPDTSWGRFPDSGDTWYAMNTPTPGAPNRLAPPQFSQVARTPTWPGAEDLVSVTATITAGTSIASATLWYDAGSGFHTSPLTGVDAYVYTAQIPPQAESTLVKYYMEAVDSKGQSTLHPDGAPEATYRYKVGYTPPTVLINEFLADNEHVNQDEAGEYDDWVELYNDSAFTVDIGGMYLTDDAGEPTKWPFPSGTSIAPGGHVLVWCDGNAGQGPLHTTFKLNRDGEEIGLFDSEGHGLVSLDWIAFGQQQDDVSYGRRPDGADVWEFLDPPTPGMSND
jgi:spore coat protein CotH